MNRNLHKISVVAPVLNEELVVEDFYRRTAAVLKKLSQDFEIIFVDDGSNDYTLSKLKKIHQDDHNVRIISFSRNFGHAAAISAGLEYASGDAVAIIDSDLQDPPEVIYEFVNKWREGYDVVYGIRLKRKEFFLKRFSYWFFYRLLCRLSSIDIPLDAGDFSLLDRKVVKVINLLPERNRFLRGLRSWAGFKQYGLKYERSQRLVGQTKYSFKKLLRLALDGIFSFSYLPLRLTTFVGLAVAIIGFVAAMLVLYLRLVRGVVGVPGFTSIIITILFIGGVQLVAIGIVGEYLARVYDEVKHRQLYVIEEKIGL